MTAKQISNLKKKDIVYYARIVKQTGIYEVCELSIRTLEGTYFVGTDKHDKKAYCFSYENAKDTIFINRRDALNKVITAQKLAPTINSETEYEEY